MGLGLEITTPITPGDEVQTYVLTKARPLPASQIRHVFIRPSDVPGATFAIESVRLIFRREHLASIQSGVGWQGMREVYRESIASRAPERLQFALDVPPAAWLDLALGTVDEGASRSRSAVAVVTLLGAEDGSPPRAHRDDAVPLGGRGRSTWRGSAGGMSR